MWKKMYKCKFIGNFKAYIMRQKERERMGEGEGGRRNQARGAE